MDLDKMKDAWNKVDFSPQIGEEKIFRMLDNKGKSALSRLLLYEKISLILMIIIVWAPFIHNRIFENPGLHYQWFTIAWFEVICIVTIFWEIFKIRLLKSIDVTKSDLITSLKSITRYRKYLQYEILVATIWLMIFVLSFFIPWAKLIPSHLLIYFIIGLCVYLVFVVLLILVLYKYMYSPKIKRIESSIKEIQYFEQEDKLSEEKFDQ